MKVALDIVVRCAFALIISCGLANVVSAIL